MLLSTCVRSCPIQRVSYKRTRICAPADLVRLHLPCADRPRARQVTSLAEPTDLLCMVRRQGLKSKMFFLFLAYARLLFFIALQTVWHADRHGSSESD